ncbi:MAG: hypothetical protein ABEI52_12640, partial [Halobacteriaceae archaeon]
MSDPQRSLSIIFSLLLMFGAVVPAAVGATPSSIAPEEPLPSPPGNAGTHAETGREATPEIGAVQRVSFHLMPNTAGSIRVEVTYELTADVSSLFASIPRDATLRSKTGFSYRGEEVYELKWDETTSSPSFTIVVGNESGTYGLNYVDTGSWAFTGTRVYSAYYSTSADAYQYTWQAGDKMVAKAKIGSGLTGYAGTKLAYIGDHDRISVSGREQQFRVVVPRVASPDQLNEGLSALARSSRMLRVGNRDPIVNVFLAPKPVREGGVTLGESGDQQDYWVGPDSTSPYSLENVLVHEYVHTRQSLSLGDRMAWFTEASAEYYAALFSYQQGYSGFSAFHSDVMGVENLDAVLSRPSSWSTTLVPYSKGYRVLAALDARIRQASGGDRSLQYVFRQMNAHEGEISLADFKRIVEDVAGKSLDSWIERYVTTSSVPEV